jgi:formate dehydrogenase gamma subunit
VAALDAAKAGNTTGEKINWWVRRLYLGLIVGVIGAMLLHNGSLMARKLAVIRRASRPFLRMTRGQRIQHAVLALSFVVLAVTGFALKYPDSWIAVLLGSSEPFRRTIHRVAGVIMLAGGAYHVLYVLFSAEGRQLVRDFFPRTQDGKDLLINARFLAGLSKVRARIGRFGYAEKMEYWAVVWGTILMGATGLMIWFKMDVTRFLPRWFVDVALNIHYYEAILACLAILVWHFYHVIFDPDVYPANLAFLDGRVSEHWQEEEHPLQKPVLAETVATAQETEKKSGSSDSSQDGPKQQDSGSV